jgi:hypothetical protein
LARRDMLVMVVDIEGCEVSLHKCAMAMFLRWVVRILEPLRARSTLHTATQQVGREITPRDASAIKFNKCFLFSIRVISFVSFRNYNVSPV